MPIGKIGSFATTEAPQDYISGALQNVENQSFRYRAERRLAEEKKEAAKIEEEKQLAEHLKNFNIDLTGSQSIDDLSQSFAQESFGKYAELARQLQTTTDPNERLKLRTEQARINQNISALKQIPGILKEKVEFISKNVDKLNPDDVDIIQEKLGMLEKGNAKVYLDENKVPRINIYKVDENGQVTGILEKEQTVAEFVNSINPHMKSNYSDMLEKAVKNTAVADVTTQTGVNIFQEKKVKDEIANEKAESFAEMIVNNPDEAYAFAKAKGIDLNNKEALKEAVKKDFKNSLDVTTKQDVDSALISANKPTKDSGKEDKKPIVFGDDPIYVTKTGTKANTKLGRGYIGYSLGNPSIDYGGGKRKVIRGIYASPYDNKVKLWVEEVGFESSSKDDFKLNATGLAKEKQAKEKAKKEGKTLDYNDFYATLSPNDYEYRKVSTKDTNERLLDFKGDAGEILEYANELGFDVGELETMYKAKAQRDKKSPTPKSGSKPKTTTKKRTYKGLDSNGNPIFE